MKIRKFIVVGVLLLFVSLMIFIFLKPTKQYFSRKIPSHVTRTFMYPVVQDTRAYNNGKPVDLVFYFYGAGCNESFFLSPFKRAGLNVGEYNAIYRKDLIFLSLGYDTNLHWSSPDIVQDTIKEMWALIKRFNIRRVYLFGFSMGGALALDVLSLADNKLKELIYGVMAVFPITDYSYTLSNTKRENIRKQLKLHFLSSENPEELMKLSSPVSYISRVPTHTRIILVEGKFDSHVPKGQIEKYYEELKDSNKNIQLVEYNVDHKLALVEKEFGELVQAFLR